MKLQQTGQTIELLKMKLLAELKDYNDAVEKGFSTEYVEPLYLKIKATSEKIKELNKAYSESLNKELLKFDRHKANI